MAQVTAAQYKVGMANHVDQNVIDIIQRNSYLMDHLQYDDAVSPGTGGSTLVYGYTMLKTPVAATGRQLNADYTPQAAEREIKQTALTIMGAAFEIDRVIAKNSNRFIDEVAFQLEQATKGTVSRFQYLAIHGDFNTTKANASPEFDGLSVLLTGKDTEIDGSSLDVSGQMTDTKAELLCEAIDQVIAAMDRKPDAILCNSKVAIKLNAAARKLNYNTRSEDAFGRPVDGYNGTPIIDLKQYYNGTATVDVIPVSSKATDIYFVSFGMDALHAVVPSGTGIGLETRTPNFKDAGAVKRGDVELVAAICLKNTKSCAVLRGVVVEA